jgi:hypothetical protein
MAKSERTDIRVTQYKGSQVQILSARPLDGAVETGFLPSSAAFSVPAHPLHLRSDDMKSGIIWGPAADRCALNAVPAASIDCRSGCRYRCVVVSDPCPAIFRSTCTGTPGPPSRSARSIADRAVAGAPIQRGDDLVPMRGVAENSRADPAAARRAGLYAEYRLKES